MKGSSFQFSMNFTSAEVLHAGRQVYKAALKLVILELRFLTGSSIKLDGSHQILVENTIIK